MGWAGKLNIKICLNFKYGGGSFEHMFGKEDTDHEKVGFMLLTDNAFVGVIGLPGEGH